MARTLLLILLLGWGNAHLSATTEFRVGVGKAIITDPATGLVMAGFGEPEQKTRGVLEHLYARAFIVEEQSTGKRIVLLNTDLWAMTHALKRRVITVLRRRFGHTYGFENCLFSANHHHSGPGGYSEYNLYNLPGGGFDETNFRIIVRGMVTAIERAHYSMVEGNVHFGMVTIENGGQNRSIDAYRRNPKRERDHYGQPTDNTLYQLQFSGLMGKTETLLGILNWYALHPTGFGQHNHLVSGDSKGQAASIVESCHPGLVAAFANGSGGDVSGNPLFGGIPRGVDDHHRVSLLAERQAEAALGLLWSADLRPLSGGLDYRHQWWDMSQRTGSIGALGLSFAAGSTEDGNTGLPFREGRSFQPEFSHTSRSPLVILKKLAVLGNLPILPPDGLARKQTSIAQYPKPVMLYSGAKVAGAPLTPNVLPFQLLRLGQLVLAGVPAEMTTMAGRRLRQVIHHHLPESRWVVPVNYANQYAQYVTTPEEYNAQHYEGASTLFGWATLRELLAIYRELAYGLHTAAPTTTHAGHSPPNYLAAGKVHFLNRVTLRNETARAWKVQFFREGDPVNLRELKSVTVAPHQEMAVIFASHHPIRYLARLRNGEQRLVPTARGQLLTIRPQEVLRSSNFVMRDQF